MIYHQKLSVINYICHLWLTITYQIHWTSGLEKEWDEGGHKDRI